MRSVSYILLFLCSFGMPYCAHSQGWLWGRGNTGSSMDGWAVAADPAGNVLAGGINFGYRTAYFGSYSVPYSGGGGFQCIVAKYNTDGAVQWVRSIDDGDSWLINVAADASGNFYLLGSFRSASVKVGIITLTNPIAPEPQFFLVKYDPSGNILWAKNGGNANYGGGSVTTLGIILGHGGIATDGSGNVYIATSFNQPTITVGSTTLTNSFTAGTSDDIMVAKYDASGNVVWAKSFGGSRDDYPYGITVTPAGNVYIAGVFNSPTLTFGGTTITDAAPASGYNTNVFVAELDNSGNTLWAQSSSGGGQENAIGIASDVSGNVYVTGGFGNDIHFSGTTLISPYTDHASLYLVKFDPSNNVSWYKVIKGTDVTVGYSIAMSACGIIWVSGIMNSVLDIDGHSLAVPSCSPDPIFIAGYKADGSYVASSALQSGGDDQNGIACDAAGNVYMCSDYWGNMTRLSCTDGRFVVGSDTLASSDSATEILYIAKYASVKSAQQFTHGDTVVCIDKTVTLTAAAGHVSYTWNHGGEGQTFTAADAGVFVCSGYDSCSSHFADTFHVVHCECKNIFVPNTFTPNGDGEDDVFYPRSGSSTDRVKSFRIYDRWGELMFERDNIGINDVSNAWDGTFRGQAPKPDVYVWVLDVECTERTVNMKGSITIIK